MTQIFLFTPSQPEYHYLRKLVVDATCSVSVISKVETLGYQKITKLEIEFFSNIFKFLLNHPVNDAIINRAISIKQFKRIPLGDSLIAATALEFNLELLTRNIKDFEDIKGLIVSNPIV